MKFLIKKKIEILIYIIFFSVSLLMLYLSNSGYWNIVHGPLYYSYAEGFYDYNSLKSSMYVIPRVEDVWTVQIGVSFFLYISILIFGKNFWFIGYSLFVTAFWHLAYIQLKKFFKNFILIKPKDVLLVFILIFFQPYNLNDIAAFSNYSIYLPLLIFCAIKFINLFEGNKLELNLLNIIFFLFIFFGFFFRVHHLIFLFSIIIFLLILKKYRYFKFSLAILFLVLSLTIIIIYFTPLSGSLKFIRGFVFSIMDSFQYQKIVEFHESNKFFNPGMGLFWIEKIIRSLEIYSFFLFLPKFISNNTISLSIHILFFLIYVYISYFNFKTESNFKKFTLFSGIFLFGSSIFIFVLPMYELSYLLSTNWIIIINYYIFLKNVFKNFFFKLLSITTLLLIFILGIAYIGILKTNDNLIETPAYKIWYKELIKDISEIDKDSLIYFDTNNPQIPEIYYWLIKKRKFCNFNLSPNDCSKILKIKEISNIYIIKKEYDPLKINDIKIFLSSHSYSKVKENKNVSIYKKIKK